MTGQGGLGDVASSVRVHSVKDPRWIRVDGSTIVPYWYLPRKLSKQSKQIPHCIVHAIPIMDAVAPCIESDPPSPTSCPAMAALPGVALLAGVVSAWLGVDPVAVAGALAVQAWATQAPVVCVEYPRVDNQGPGGSTDQPLPVAGVIARSLCSDQASEVLHLVFACLAGVGVERLLSVVDGAFGVCVSYQLPSTLPYHEGATPPPRPTYALGAPMVSHQRILKPSLTRTARQCTPGQWAKASRDAAEAHDPTLPRTTLLLCPRYLAVLAQLSHGCN